MTIKIASFYGVDHSNRIDHSHSVRHIFLPQSLNCDGNPDHMTEPPNSCPTR